MLLDYKPTEGQTEFNFGHNERKGAAPEPEPEPEKLLPVLNDENPYKLAWAFLKVQELTTLALANNRLLEFVEQVKTIGEKMDLKSHRSSREKTTKFENRDFIDPQIDLPKRGAVKWRIDAFREAKNKRKGMIGFIDITAGKKKRVMGLRKGFTLDALMDELGTKTEKWIGKTISLTRGGSEGQYVNVA